MKGRDVFVASALNLPVFAGTRSAGNDGRSGTVGSREVRDERDRAVAVTPGERVRFVALMVAGGVVDA